MECLAEAPADDAILEERVLHFLSSHDDSAVTGVRRMGRDAFVEYVASVAVENGMKASIYPETDGDIIIFYTWEGSQSDILDVLNENPGADILYGQDLCHQVPAVVRYGKR